MKRLAEGEHVCAADDAAQRAQVCVSDSILVYRSYRVNVLAGSLLEGLSRGALTGRCDRKGERQDDEIN